VLIDTFLRVGWILLDGWRVHFLGAP